MTHTLWQITLITCGWEIVSNSNDLAELKNYLNRQSYPSMPRIDAMFDCCYYFSEQNDSCWDEPECWHVGRHPKIQAEIVCSDYFPHALSEIRSLLGAYRSQRHMTLALVSARGAKRAVAMAQLLETILTRCDKYVNIIHHSEWMNVWQWTELCGRSIPHENYHEFATAIFEAV